MRKLSVKYFTVLSGRQFIAFLLLVLVLPAALLYGCGRLRAGKPVTVAQSVMLGGQNFGGLTAEEAAVVLGEYAGEIGYLPVDAILEETTGGVIPELYGSEIDVESTLALLLAAKSGEILQPVMRQLPPAVTISDFPYAPLYRGNPQKRQVTFLINVAWGNEYLGEIMDVLTSEKAGATFFLVGRWVRGNSEEARQLVSAGFEVASHGDSDALSMAKASFPLALDDIRKANETIENICGVRPLYFSPHRGELSDNVVRAAAQENCRTVMWTVDTVDWKLPGVAAMYEKVLSKADGGSLILMHPTEQTAEFLRQIIPALREKGLEPVSLSELICPVIAGKGGNSL